MREHRRYTLVLSVYFTSRRFAFTLFEGPISPFNWGVREVRGKCKERRSLAQITVLLDQCLPNVLVLQNASPSGTRRAWRVMGINTALAEFAEKRGMPAYSYTRAEVNAAFGSKSKQQLAESIA